MAQYLITNDQTGIDFETGRDGVNRVLQNCHNLLMTSMGEIPFDRKRGVNPAIYDMNIEDVRMVLDQELDRVMIWEPRARVQSSDVELREDGSMRIKCVINIKEGLI